MKKLLAFVMAAAMTLSLAAWRRRQLQLRRHQHPRRHQLCSGRLQHPR